MEETVKVLRKLVRLSRFGEVLNRENLGIGLNVWVRSTGIQLILNVILLLTGLQQTLGSLGFLVLVIIGFVLLQWAVTSEARHRFSITAPSTAWFSVFWRVFVYMLPVTFLLISLMVDTALLQDPAQAEAVSQQMMQVQLIVLFISIVPTGIATSQTLRNHLLQRLGPQAMETVREALQEKSKAASSDEQSDKANDQGDR